MTWNFHTWLILVGDALALVAVALLLLQKDHNMKVADYITASTAEATKQGAAIDRIEAAVTTLKDGDHPELDTQLSAEQAETARLENLATIAETP